jgi:hypothetical protein
MPSLLAYSAVGRLAAPFFSSFMSAYFSLHIRRNSLNTASLAARLGNKRTEPKQIRHAAVRAPSGHGDERIGFRDVGPRRRQRRECAGIVVEKHAVLAPGLPDRHQLERPSSQRVERMGDLENLSRMCAIDRS